MDGFVIYYSKRKILLHFLASLLFFCMAIWLVMDGEVLKSKCYVRVGYSSGFWLGPKIVLCIIVASGLMGLVGLFMFGRRLLHKGPAMLFASHGITHASYGFIPWSEVSAVERTKTKNGDVACIKLKNPGSYLGKYYT